MLRSDAVTALITIGFIILGLTFIVLANTWYAKSLDKKAARIRDRVLPELASVINGRVDGDRVIGTWHGFPVEAKNDVEASRWQVAMTVSPGPQDWQLIDRMHPFCGPVLETGDEADVQTRVYAAEKNLESGSGTDEDRNQMVALKALLEKQKQEGAALIERVGPTLAQAMKGNLEDDQCFGISSSVAYEAQGRLLFKTIVSKAEFPNARQFTDQLDILLILQQSSAAVV